MRKSGLGRDPLSWIKSTVKERQAKEKGIRKSEARGEIPKFKTFEVKLTVLLREDQVEFLEKTLREINKNRDSNHRKERITKNTIIRTCIDAFRDIRINLKNVPDEEELLSRLKEKITSD